MSERELKQLDRRLLIAGNIVTAIGCAAMLLAALPAALAWRAAHYGVDAVGAMLCVFGFAMLGMVMINSGARLRRAYRAGMRLWI